MRRLITFLASRWWLVWIVILVNFASFFILFGLEGRFEALTGQPVYDTQNGLTREQIIAQLPLYTGEAQSAYLVFAIYDFVFPFIASVFVIVTITWLLRKNTFSLARWLLQSNIIYLLFLGTLFDWSENISLLAILSTSPNPSDLWIDMALLAKRLKLVMLGINFSSLFLSALFLMMNIIYRINSKQTKQAIH